MNINCGTDNVLNFEDNFLTEEQHKSVFNYCKQSKYVYGEWDRPGLPPTGMVAEISEHQDIYKLFKSKTKPFVEGLVLERMYINAFAPSEKPHFHTDSSIHTDVTCIYYANPTWELDDGGATEFYIDGNFLGIAPLPNRLSYFNADIPHRATTFRKHYRFTLAIRYSDPNR